VSTQHRNTKVLTVRRDGKTVYQAACQCGWASHYTYSTQEKAQNEADTHTVIMADDDAR
jgi:hypothetical protein